MPLVGIYFTRALAERRREFVYERIKSWNVNNNLSIVSISKEEVPLPVSYTHLTLPTN